MIYLCAWQLLQVSLDAGLRVPHDVAILGLDNDALICGFSKPTLSSIDPDTESIGREAMRTIGEMMDRPVVSRKPIVRQVPPKGVVVRTSTETYPVDPSWLSDALVFIRRHVADRLSAVDIWSIGKTERQARARCRWIGTCSAQSRSWRRIRRRRCR